ncbi:MAG: acyl-CoA dehydrogenase family protein [Rhodospirillales bacterium]|jgi:alkylation response protein AidB-like acyl-CoA dehydrogenase|nr:pimeloyl-CoA dehydrogenase small subunit [Rhodospirillaceae bacterium]MDP6426619.1 acyl-CoA dehydrogenase family protein [Rhodospirillales bacterium]MDP6644665.1 acyl-CoA dehydrogenase family protein [Rhodospirillales bacterium]MDP6842240.1 acyl-CoA dehydrogenase family protein [Rhodospirillales bacterium]|tara:strand:- start:68 stop:1222 length:1155 start_codon:yes stop_codon:yes gene_type:complete
MDFTLSEEQQLLKNSAERYVERDYGFERRRDIIAGADGFGRETWAQMAELGWLGLPFAEEDGGFGGTPVETMVVMEAIGRGLMVEPYLTTVVLAGGLIAACGNADQKSAILPKVASGEMLLAFAYAEPRSRFDPADVETTAAKDGNGYRLNGHKAVVLHGGAADKIIVSARTAGGQRDAAGITLFLVDADAAGLEVLPYPTIDGSQAAEVRLADVASDNVLGDVDTAYPAIDAVLDAGIAAVAAEAVGAMQVLHDDTLDYLKTRRQFGQPIGSFQALQHRIVDMYIELEQARSAAVMATLRIGAADPEIRRHALSAAKVQIGRSSRFIGQNAVQLHGGIGMTDELRVSHYFKRLTVIATQFGNVDFHLDRMANTPTQLKQEEMK